MKQCKAEDGYQGNQQEQQSGILKFQPALLKNNRFELQQKLKHRFHLLNYT
jgi:hypothetical protein